MSICRTLAVVPKRAMSSQVSKTPTSVPTKTKSEPEMEYQSVNADDQPANPSGVGYKPDKYARDIFLNPLLTPPPRSPRTPEDFMNPEKIGHWQSKGYDYEDKVNDTYIFHETCFGLCFGVAIGAFVLAYGPDFKYREWARREAFIRTAKREALGIPLIDRNVVDPARIVLPSDEELGDFEVTM